MKFDVLPIVLAAAGFGLVLLPIAAIAGASDGALVAMAGVYGTAITVLAPLVARRSRNGSNGHGPGGD